MRTVAIEGKEQREREWNQPAIERIRNREFDEMRGELRLSFSELGFIVNHQGVY
jgi:hypothetical protein